MSYLTGNRYSLQDNEADWLDEEIITPMKSLHQYQHNPTSSSSITMPTRRGGETMYGLIDRICALKLILPYRLRNSVWRCYQFCYAKSSVLFAIVGKVSWVITTSLILVGLPMFIEYDREQGILAYEKEQKLQQGAENML